MKNMVALVKLGLEARGDLEQIRENIPRYCMDSYEDCSSEELMKWDDTDENRIAARKELAKHENEAYEVGRYILCTAYVLEFYKADDDGEFSSGSDYDW